MPTYPYKDLVTGQEVEISHPMSEPAKVFVPCESAECKACAGKTLKRHGVKRLVAGGTATLFMGGGWTEKG